MDKHDQTAEKIKQKLLEHFSNSRVEIRNDSHLHAGHAGARQGGHFYVEIEAKEFQGISPLARQRLVLAVVANMMDSEIHALSMRCIPQPD